MYSGWQISQWQSPVVDLDRVLMVSLTDENRQLVVVLENPWASGRPRWRARFHNYSGYRNIDERYREGLWRWLDESGQRCGATFIVAEDPPFASWATQYLQDFEPATKHFVIATDDDVIEVLSAAEPVWEELEGAAPAAPLPGKSRHLYVGEDDEVIKQVVNDIKARNRPQ